MRQDKDSLGVVDIPDHALWGAQTQRAIENFRASGIPISHFPSLLRALAQVKRAAAAVNASQGRLDQALASAIMQAADEVIKGAHGTHFPVGVLQGGAGTSSNMNMNMNEVLANRALAILGHPHGAHHILHPNNHVNLCQSTNDVYPTAIRLALMAETIGLQAALAGLAEAFATKGAACYRKTATCHAPFDLLRISHGL